MDEKVMEGSKNSLKISSKPQVVTAALCSADNCGTTLEDSAESTDDDGAHALCPNSPLPAHPTASSEAEHAARSRAGGTNQLARKKHRDFFRAMAARERGEHRFEESKKSICNSSVLCQKRDEITSLCPNHLQVRPIPPLGSPIPAAECHEGCIPSVSTVADTATGGHRSQQAEKKRRSQQEFIFEQ